MSDVFVTRETKLTKQKYIPIHDVDEHHRDEHGLRRSLVAARRPLQSPLSRDRRP